MWRSQTAQVRKQKPGSEGVSAVWGDEAKCPGNLGDEQSIQGLEELKAKAEQPLGALSPELLMPP